MPIFMMILLMFVSILLILVILLQRGRGGGLVGALSGLGGQSAFGTKAGDMFTRITIGIAAVWVLLAGIAGGVLRSHTVKFKGSEPLEIRSRTEDNGAGATSTTDDTNEESAKDMQDGSKETNAKGTDSNNPAKLDGDSAKEPEADKRVPVKGPGSAEEPGDSK